MVHTSECLVAMDRWLLHLACWWRWTGGSYILLLGGDEQVVLTSLLLVAMYRVSYISLVGGDGQVVHTSGCWPVQSQS